MLRQSWLDKRYFFAENSEEQTQKWKQAGGSSIPSTTPP
jgi:hypothetical protein